MFLIVNSAGVKIDTAGIELAKVAGAAVAVGDILQRDTANNGLERATSASYPASANTGLFGVAKSIQVSADVTVEVVPLIHGMILEADLTNDSSADDNLQRMVLTDHDTLNNTGTDNAAKEGVFLQLVPVGAASDKKALVMYVGSMNQLNV